jgi:hypothetical protein
MPPPWPPTPWPPLPPQVHKSEVQLSFVPDLQQPSSSSTLHFVYYPGANLVGVYSESKEAQQLAAKVRRCRRCGAVLRASRGVGVGGGGWGGGGGVGGGGWGVGGVVEGALHAGEAARRSPAAQRAAGGTGCAQLPSPAAAAASPWAASRWTPRTAAASATTRWSTTW